MKKIYFVASVAYVGNRLAHIDNQDQIALDAYTMQSGNEIDYSTDFSVFNDQLFFSGRRTLDLNLIPEYGNEIYKLYIP